MLSLEIESLRVQYESLLNGIINAVRGILNTHMITPLQILRYFNTFQVDETQDLRLPIPEGGDPESVISIPEDYVAHIVKLVDTLWIQLNNNEWLYVAPNVEKLTIVCNKNELFDRILKGTGKLKFFDQ
ncbi:hypothetical protein PR048_001628, partial [Dryococelus australis]